MFGAICLAGGSVVGWLQGAPETRLTFVSVGQGDCAVFQHDGSTVMIDVGPKTRFFDAGERIIVPKLHEMGVRSVDLIVLTHPDADHTGGLAAILKSFPGAKLLISEAFRDHGELGRQLHAVGVSSSDVIWLDRAARASIGKFSLRLAALPPPEGSPDNDGSVFCHLSGLGASAVVSGDAPQWVEQSVSRSGDWSAQVMTAGHHGSQTSTGSTWINEVRPKFAVISCGRDNTYGHPAPSVLARLHASGIRVLRTDRSGDITFRVGAAGFVPSP